MATFYKVVVVTINYRLGALGFLSTADVNSPGNYGILDQAMALRWVYENAEKFGGDKDSITLFGPGAGAASAGLLMVAPQTSKMVTKVIAQVRMPLFLSVKATYLEILLNVPTCNTLKPSELTNIGSNLNNLLTCGILNQYTVLLLG